MTRKWRRERERDPYHRLATEAGYRSRAVYKLLEISKQYRLIKKGDVVIDLGAFPGGWIQGAKSLIGEEGYILGIDLKPIESFPWSNVKTIIGDITDLDLTYIQNQLPRKPNVILSDVSPNISGIWEVDHIRQIDLAKSSFQIAKCLLRRGGNFLVKAFRGEFFQEFVKEIRTEFRYTKVIKPSASRKRSSEVYVVALNFRNRVDLPR